uniref:Zinc finger protein weckle n=2 Tax=Drosophila melanogaster TaxID=7227 RepID=WEK_DROME|eukprot:NP_001260472.1 weckle, isoform B [Drosophila melanogaster]
MGVPTSDWIYWCRLCARDDVVYKVRERDDDLVRIISKCFDVEMTLEEPELGSMLCEECYSVIGQLITFSDSVSKVQAIFELLRHSEPQDSQDLDALRLEYGLPPACKQDLEFLDIDDTEDRCSLVEELTISDHSTSPSPDFEAQTVRTRANLKQCNSDPKVLASPTASIPEVETKRSRRQQFAAKRNSKVYTATESDDEEAILDEDEAVSPPPLKRKRGRPKGSGKQKNVDDSDNVTSREPDDNAKSKQDDKTSELSMSPHGSQSSNFVDYPCKICNETFMSFMALRRHKHDMHGGPKKYVCDHCGKGLKTFTSLVEHQLVHTEEKPCICPVCNAGFKNKARLRVHSQTHGEPKFECNVCGKKLQTRAILNKHKYVHTDERRFKCEVCGSGCKNSTALKIHLLGHTGLRPYVCKYCGKAFASNTNCRSHKWKKHPELASKEDETESSRVPVPTLEELRAITREMAKAKQD